MPEPTSAHTLDSIDVNPVAVHVQGAVALAAWIPLVAAAARRLLRQFEHADSAPRPIGDA